MNEQLLQFIWRFQYFNKTELATTDGHFIQIISPGTLNANQGPDFTNAKVKIGNTVWAGAIELHLKSSDWKKHKHGEDDNYKNVILHVVYEQDDQLSNQPVLELRERVSHILLSRYKELMLSQQFIPCEKHITKVENIVRVVWKERLVAERLESKTSIINSYLKTTNQHWEESFWILLAKNFGTKTNAEAFEAIAKSVSINILAKHKKNLIQLEALLLGQAGLLLEKKFDDKYALMLQKEYQFLQSKYNLRPILFPVYFLRMRPGNFPTVRLAQLASLIFNSVHLFSKILEEESIKEIKKRFAIQPNSFWDYHYTLSDHAHLQPKPIGTDMIDNIIINTIVPMLFAYGNTHKSQKQKNKAILFLEQTSSEKNTIINGFKQLGLSCKTAYDSQSFIQLKNNYCHNKRCLQCAIGNSIIKC